MKSLYIIDLNNDDHSIKIDNSYIIYLNRGNIFSTNCKQIKLNKLKTNTDIRKKIVNEFFNKVKKIKNDFFYELEIFNLRNDKNLNVSKIINFLKVKKILKSNKFNNVYLITDNQISLKALKSINKKIIVKKSSTQKQKKINFFYQITKFFLKVFLISFLTKFISQKKLIESNIGCKKGCITLYPNFFYNDKENFFRNNKFVPINFLFTDETHLNHSFLKVLKNYLKLKDKIINVESFISLSNLLKVYLNVLNLKLKYNFAFKDNLIIENVDLTDFYQEAFNISFLNRSKLEIYSNPLKKLIKKLLFNEFHIYLFEYSFGFFLIKNLKKQNCQVIGYQHGIFSKNLLWLDIILKKNKPHYYPHQIVSNYSSSQKDYRILYKNKIKKITFSKKCISNIAKKIKIKNKISKKSIRKILILSGTHDIQDIYFFFKNDLKFRSNTSYYIKAHPKNKFHFESEKNLKKVENLKYQTFNEVIISSTSTLMYDFKNLKKNFRIFCPDYKFM